MKSTALNTDQFNRLIAYIKNQHINSVQAVRADTFGALHRLGKRKMRDVTLCPKGVPKIDDRFDMSVYRKWMLNIDASDKAAISQLLQIDAACVWRKS